METVLLPVYPEDEEHFVPIGLNSVEGGQPLNAQNEISVAERKRIEILSDCELSHGNLEVGTYRTAFHLAAITDLDAKGWYHFDW